MTREEAIAISRQLMGKDFFEAQIDLLIALGVLRVSDSPTRKSRLEDAYDEAMQAQEAMEEK